MTPPALARILALVALLPVLCSTGPAGAWYCEGRRCAQTLWRCCCATPAPGKDRECAGSTAKQAAAPDCSGGCGCVLVIAPSEDRTTPSAGVPLVFPPAAPLPATFALYTAPVFTEITRSQWETRGPPRAAATLSTPSLRAPPAA